MINLERCNKHCPTTDEEMAKMKKEILKNRRLNTIIIVLSIIGILINLFKEFI